MRKLTLFLALALCSYALSAQVAVKAGVNFANMVFESSADELTDVTEDGSLGFTIGAAFILPVNDFFAIQPEVQFIQKGVETSYKVLGEEYVNKLTYNYIDIPILARVSLGGTYGEGLGIYLNAGPYIGYALNGKSKIESPLGDNESDIEFDDEDRQKRVDFGLAGGAGLTIGNLFIEARYMYGTNNLLDDDANNSNDNDFDKYQHRGLALTAGLIF